MQTETHARAGPLIVLLLTVVCGCRPEPSTKYTLESEAAMICIAREAALAQGWTLEDRIYSVRRDGTGWVVEVDLSPGYTGEGEPAVVDDGTFFVYINAEGKATRIVSFAGTIPLPEE